MRRFVFIAFVVLSALLSSGAAPRWEAVDAPGRIFTEQRAEQEGIDVAVNDSAIYVASQHQVSVKVFTILGQLISQETLPAGTHRLQMSAKGIYILKIGTNITRRVTI
ncbi:MAG: T9SS type A sorting domain-containing protein [Duncaniella sp.]|nr:T9SS type A sorting domain-containing protein [Bacteroides sp.]MDE5827082.1 T9SS type A sorting domain-containing protein [Duncaniella sp.]MBD5300352.1 T9SS type A sorting domain-containing protein [Bacteroides sp.]MBD5318424.1 T9SS type A sorting domain-containing protein [Bacteroides sp.]MDE6823103.1 T9SS type A sorting domain-containing protein [Duncaniella sp.]